MADATIKAYEDKMGAEGVKAAKSIQASYRSYRKQKISKREAEPGCVDEELANTFGDHIF